MSYLTLQLVRRMTTSMTGDFANSTLLKIVEQKDGYIFKEGNFANIVPKKTIVEFSSPNIAKRFHVGHMRSTIVGQAIANIMAAAGHKVTRINYLGDWGMQFAILSVGFERYGNKTLMQSSPLKHLYDVYVKANTDLVSDVSLKKDAEELFCKMENEDTESLKFWKQCCELSMLEYDKLYRSIFVMFNYYEAESMYRKHSQDVLQNLRKNNLLVPLENNTEGVDLSNSSWKKLRKIPNSMNKLFPALARSNGTSLYLTRDIAAAISRKKKYNFEKMIYVTDQSQELHFLQLFSILELLGNEWASENSDTLQHITFGRISGMKTRNGKVIFLEDILSEAFQRTKEDRLKHSTRKTNIGNEDEMIHTLGLSGLIGFDLRPKRNKDYKFSWSNALQSKGHTGIFLQYTHARLMSLIRNCGVKLSYDVNCSTLCEDKSAIDLVSHLTLCNKAAWIAYTELEPSHITNYMFELSNLVGKALNQLPVKGENIEIAQPRLLLFHCSQIILNNLMKVIGMRPLDKM